MPTYEIQAPNGKKYRIEGPAGATDAQIRAEVMRQHPDVAPDHSRLTPAEARTALARGQKRLQDRTREMSPEKRRAAYRNFEADPNIRALTEQAQDAGFWSGVALGAMKPVDNLATWASNIPVVGPAIDRLGESLGMPSAREAVSGNQAARENNTSVSGQLIGNVAGTVPVAYLPGGALVQGGVAGAVLSEDPTDAAGVATDTVVGAVTGKLVERGLQAVKPVARRVVQAVRPGGLSPAERAAGQEVVRAGERAGGRTLTTDINPPTTFIGRNAQALGERIPIAGTGGVRAAQQAERIEATKTILREYGGDDVVRLFDDMPTAVDDVARSLTAQRSRDLTRFSGQKNRVIDGIQGNLQPADVTRTLNAIDEQVRRLTGIDDVEYAPVIDRLTRFGANIASGKNLRQVEENRKLLGAMFDDGSLATIKGEGQKAINAIYGPLREDMGGFIAARGGKGDVTAWRTANDRLAAMAGELDSAAFRNVLKNTELTPEAVGRLLFSRNRSDVVRLVASLDAPGRARAQAAVLQRAFDKAISTEGLSVERFVNNLSQMGDSVGVVFQGDDLMRVQGLVRWLDATRRAATAAAHPPTGAQNMPLLAGYSLAALAGKLAIPVAAVGGAFARAYESAPVRNLLLRIGKAAPGSAEQGKLITQVTRLITAATVNQRGKLGTAANDEMPALISARDQEGQGDQQALP